MPTSAPIVVKGYSAFSPGDYMPVDGLPATSIDAKGIIASFFYARIIATSIEQGGGVGTAIKIAFNVQIWDGPARNTLLFDQTVICSVILVLGNPPIASDSGEGNPTQSADGTTASIRTRICNGVPVQPYPDPVTGNFKPAPAQPGCPAIPPFPILSNLKGASQIYQSKIEPLQITVTIPPLSDGATSYTLRVASTWNGTYVDYMTGLQPGQQRLLNLQTPPFNTFGLVGIDKVWMLLRAVNSSGYTDGMMMKDESGYYGYKCAPPSWPAGVDSEQGNLVFDSTSSGSQLSGYWQIDMPYQCTIPQSGEFFVTHDDWPDEIINDQFTFQISYLLGQSQEIDCDTNFVREMALLAQVGSDMQLVLALPGGPKHFGVQYPGFRIPNSLGCSINWDQHGQMFALVQQGPSVVEYVSADCGQTAAQGQTVWTGDYNMPREIFIGGDTRGTIALNSSNQLVWKTSDDNFVSQTIIDTLTTPRPFTITMDTNGIIVVSDSNGSAYSSQDRGITWQPETGTTP